MLKKKAGISLGRLAHHYKQCIDAIDRAICMGPSYVGVGLRRGSGGECAR